MIYYEANESLPASRFPKSMVSAGEKFDNLESISGADFVIVPEPGLYSSAKKLQRIGKSYVKIAQILKAGVTDVIKVLTDNDTLLCEWCFAGALLVQRKSGHDFVASMGPRLNKSIAEMILVAPKQHQRIVLVTGMFGEKNGMLTLNGRTANVKYNNYMGAISAIKYKGAHVEFLPNDNCIHEWAKMQEKQLLSYKSDNTKWIVSPTYFPPDLPDMDDPLQLMVPVRDARLSIINIDGWGVGKVNVLHKYVKKTLGLNREPNLLELLSYATNITTAKHCKGIGKKLIQSARDYTGLYDGEFLASTTNNVIKQTKE